MKVLPRLGPPHRARLPLEVGGDGRFVVPRREFVPAYLRTWEEGRLREKIDEALEALRACTLCPRDCEVDRLGGKFAVCKTGRHARVSAHFPHFGEEDVLRGWRGSGTIFFAWCNLRCVFCFGGDVRILTSRGMQRIEDIFAAADTEIATDGGTIRMVKDVQVWTREGRLAPVTKAFSHPYRGPMLVIKPYGLPALMATPNHGVFAATRPGGDIHQVPARELTLSHWLVVPKPRAPLLPAELDVFSTLQPYRGSFLPPRRKVPLSVFQTLARLPRGSRPTWREVAERLGYHPAAVRNLLTEIRRGTAGIDSALRDIDLVEEQARIRFKTEQRLGVPRKVRLDTDLARLLGYYCAEGHVTAQRNRPHSHRLVFSYGRHEPELVERTRTLLRQVFNVEPTVVSRRTTVTVEAGHTSLALLLKALCGGGSRGKTVPAVLFTSPAEVVRAFLEAYWEGDGRRERSYLAVATLSRELAFGVVALLLRIGILPHYYAAGQRPRRLIEGRSVRQSEALYQIRWGREEWLGVSGLRSRRYREYDEHFLVPIRKISSVPYAGQVYNLEIDDPDHSYLASGVAVGNCQNYETSQDGEGAVVGPEALARLMLELQARGCHNINFVTPEHVVPQILEALPHAIEGGLRLPIVYNTSAYDSLHSIRLMDGVADVYMPDFKLWDRERCRRYLLAPDYADVAREVVRAMHEQVGELRVDEDGLALRGVMVRHLLMPGMLSDTRAILGWVAALSPDTYVNVMDQYYPAWKATSEKYREIGRRIHPEELDAACAAAREAGLWRLDQRWRRGLGLAWA